MIEHVHVCVCWHKSAKYRVHLKYARFDFEVVDNHNLPVALAVVIHVCTTYDSNDHVIF